MSLTLCSRYFHDQSIDPDDPDGHIDPDTIWTGLCEGDETATAWTKAFFSDYVEHSVRPVMVLGPGEYEDKRMVNSASTLHTVKYRSAFPKSYFGPPLASMPKLATTTTIYLPSRY
jgi:hypothetical protein